MTMTMTRASGKAWSHRELEAGEALARWHRGGHGVAAAASVAAHSGPVSTDAALADAALAASCVLFPLKDQSMI